MKINWITPINPIKNLEIEKIDISTVQNKNNRLYVDSVTNKLMFSKSATEQIDLERKTELNDNSGGGGTNDILLGSIQFFPTTANFIISDCYGLADGKTQYLGYLLVQNTEQLVKNHFPEMTSNNKPAPYVAACSSDGNYSAAWCAFSPILNGWADKWQSIQHITNHWLSLNSGKDNEYKLQYYILTMHEAYNNESWQIQGCKTIDGNTWETIDSQSSQTLPSRTQYTVNIANWLNNPFYAKFRFYSANNSRCIFQLRFFCLTYTDYIDSLFVCPDLQSIAPSGFKTYIYMGKKII